MSASSKREFSLTSLLSRYLERRREIRAARQLLELSDPILRDIGLTRHDILAAATAPFWKSPAGIISRAAAENRRLAANDLCAVAGTSPAAVAA
jgi:Uncharacterized conserved small protein